MVVKGGTKKNCLSLGDFNYVPFTSQLLCKVLSSLCSRCRIKDYRWPTRRSNLSSSTATNLFLSKALSSATQTQVLAGKKLVLSTFNRFKVLAFVTLGRGLMVFLTVLVSW